MKAIVLAGGGGTRLWPLSKENFPKQFLNFGAGLSLLQRSVQRLINAPFINEVVVATNQHYFALVQEQLQNIGAQCRILIEPCRRNTAPAIALAVKELGALPTEPLLVVPSDHLIEPEVIFLHALEQLQAAALNHIITFGIRPTKPETGYGYIEIGKKCSALTFYAKRFVEKPDLQTAEKYAANPHFFWNSGIFLFTSQTLQKQIQLHCPALSRVSVENFSDMPDVSIDYAIMEKSKDILLSPLAVSWSDVGSWDSVYEVMEKDQHKNVTIGQVLAIDTTNSLIIGGTRIVSTIGLDDLLIVATEEAILISKKGESQRVKALLQKLKDQAQ